MKFFPFGIAKSVFKTKPLEEQMELNDGDPTGNTLLKLGKYKSTVVEARQTSPEGGLLREPSRKLDHWKQHQPILYKRPTA